MRHGLPRAPGPVIASEAKQSLLDGHFNWSADSGVVEIAASLCSC